MPQKRIAKVAEKRKGVSKKTRFDIFKRDSFRCAYCGRTPPAVVLEVDHIVSVSDGGDNDKSNLITACFDCNRGKGATRLDNVPQSLIESHDEAVEREAQVLAFRKFIKSVKRRENKDIDDIAGIFRECFNGRELADSFKTVSVRNFLNKLPKHEVEEAMHIAASVRADDPGDAIKYFCGICWNKIKRGGGVR